MKETLNVVDMVEQKVKTYTLTIYIIDGKKETFKNVISFGPIQDRDLLSIVLMDGEQIVYPITGNIRKYSFKVN